MTQTLIKHVQPKAACASCSQPAWNSISWKSLNLIFRIEKKHSSKATTSSSWSDFENRKTFFFKNNRNRIVIWNASRARRSNDSEQKEKAARSNSTPLNVYYCFRLVNEKSLFEGAHKCQKRKTLNHFGCDTYSFSVFFFSGEGNMACLKREKNPATCLRQCHAFHVSTVALPTAKNYFTNFPHSERWKNDSKKFTMAFLIYSISPWSEASGGKKNNCCDCALALGWVSVTCNYVIFSLSPHELMLLTSMLSAEWERITFHFFISFLFKQKSEFDWHKANGLRLSQKNRWWKNKIKWGKRSREEIELDQMITPMMTRDALVKKLSTSSAVESKNRYYNSLARQLLDSLDNVIFIFPAFHSSAPSPGVRANCKSNFNFLIAVEKAKAFNESKIWF